MRHYFYALVATRLKAWEPLVQNCSSSSNFIDLRLVRQKLPIYTRISAELQGEEGWLVCDRLCRPRTWALVYEHGTGGPIPSTMQRGTFARKQMKKRYVVECKICSSSKVELKSCYTAFWRIHVGKFRTSKNLLQSPR